MIFAEERKRKIIEILNMQEKVLVPDLSELFQVSSATIRSDLNELEKEGMLKRTHGGAIRILKKSFEPNYQEKEIKYLSDKIEISKKALDFIEDQDVIILDTGTTTYQLAKQLIENNDKYITVITNDLEIALLLESSDKIQIILLGGMLRKGLHCMVGPFSMKVLEGINADKAFMATNGIDIQKGLTTPDINQAELKKNMIKISTEIYLLADTAKLGKSSFAQFATLKDLDKLIINSRKGNENYINRIEEIGVDVISAEE